MNSNFGGVKLNKFFGHDHIWFVCAYFVDVFTLVILVAQGKKEARIFREGCFKVTTDISDIDCIDDFKLQILELMY